MMLNLKLPLCEVTIPANVRETSVILAQLEFVKDRLALDPDAVIAVQNMILLLLLNI